MGAGHVGAAIAAVFASKGAAVLLGALAGHPGNIPDIIAKGNKVEARGIVNGTYNVTATTDLDAIVPVVKKLFLVVPSHAYKDYVNALKPYNDRLTETDLFVICGQGFSMLFDGELSVKRIIETNESPYAAKRIEPAVVNIKEAKQLLQVSCHPIFQIVVGGPPVLHSAIRRLIEALFPITPKLVASPAVRMAFWSNYIVHAVPAILNMGRLPDPADSRTAAEQASFDQLAPRGTGGFPYFFYGEGTNTYATRIQTVVDDERRAVAAACGLNIGDLLSDNNGDYGTNFATLREYALAPFPHNVQHVCPDSIEHRYYVEELGSLEQIIAIAELVKVKVPITAAMAFMIQAARLDKPLDTAQYKKISTFARADLVRFGARFN